MVLDGDVVNHDAMSGYVDGQIKRWVGQLLEPMSEKDRIYAIEKLGLQKNVDDLGLNEAFANFVEGTALSLQLSDQQTGEIKETLADRLRRTGLLRTDKPTMSDILRAQFGSSTSDGPVSHENTSAGN